MISYFTTSFNPTGNRLVDDSCGNNNNNGNSQQPRSLIRYTENLPRNAEWIVGNTNESSREVIIVSDDGSQRRASFVEEGGTNETLENVQFVERPLVTTGNHPIESITSPEITSRFSAAVPTPDGGLLFVGSTNNEAMSIQQLSQDGQDVTHESVRAIVNPLYDGQITYSPTNQLWAIFSSQTNERYVHAILGDDLEPTVLNLLKWNNDTNQVETVMHVSLEEEGRAVFEALSPMWADVNGDGVDDVITTVAAPGQGARLRVYFLPSNNSITSSTNNTSSNTPLLLSFAQSPTIGQGNRWLHLLGAGPIGPLGEMEIVEIRTPHVGGQVRYYRWDGGENLNVVASSSSKQYTSHAIGSRNIDKATLGDFDGDGIPELVVANQAETQLYGLQRTTASDNGMVEVWSTPLSSKISSNIAVTCSLSSSGGGSSNSSNHSSNGNTTTSEMGYTNFNIMDILFGTEDSQLIRLTFYPDETATVSAEIVGGGGDDVAINQQGRDDYSSCGYKNDVMMLSSGGVVLPTILFIHVLFIHPFI